MPRRPTPPPQDLPPGLTPELLALAKHYLASKMGRTGKGKSKARSSAQARAAVTARWDRERAKKTPPV
jgi:hypothetical protein